MQSGVHGVNCPVAVQWAKTQGTHYSQKMTDPGYTGVNAVTGKAHHAAATSAGDRIRSCGSEAPDKAQVKQKSFASLAWLHVGHIPLAIDLDKSYLVLINRSILELDLYSNQRFVACTLFINDFIGVHAAAFGNLLLALI